MCIQIFRFSYVNDLKLHTQRTGHNLYRFPQVCAVWIRRTSKDCHARDFWNSLLEEFQLFPDQVHQLVRQTRQIPARPCEADNKPGPNRIADSHKDDRDRFGPVL